MQGPADHVFTIHNTRNSTRYAWWIHNQVGLCSQCAHKHDGGMSLNEQPLHYHYVHLQSFCYKRAGFYFEHYKCSAVLIVETYFDNKMKAQFKDCLTIVANQTQDH